MHRFILCQNYMMFPLVLYPTLFYGCVLLYLRSPKGYCYSISDDVSCSSKGITYLVFYCDLVYKLRRVKCVQNSISSSSEIVKHIRGRQYGQMVIERTIGLVLGLSTALHKPFPEASHSDLQSGGDYLTGLAQTFSEAIAS